MSDALLPRPMFCNYLLNPEHGSTSARCHLPFGHKGSHGGHSVVGKQACCDVEVCISGNVVPCVLTSEGVVRLDEAIPRVKPRSPVDAARELALAVARESSFSTVAALHAGAVASAIDSIVWDALTRYLAALVRAGFVSDAPDEEAKSSDK